MKGRKTNRRKQHKKYIFLPQPEFIHQELFVRTCLDQITLFFYFVDDKKNTFLIIRYSGAKK